MNMNIVPKSEKQKYVEFYVNYNVMLSFVPEFFENIFRTIDIGISNLVRFFPSSANRCFMFYVPI